MPNTGPREEDTTHAADLSRVGSWWWKMIRTTLLDAPMRRGGLDQRVLWPGTCRLLRRIERRTSANTNSRGRCTHTISEAYRVRTDCAYELVKVERETQWHRWCEKNTNDGSAMERISSDWIQWKYNMNTIHQRCLPCEYSINTVEPDLSRGRRRIQNWAGKCSTPAAS
jgi:hypothetical protein